MNKLTEMLKDALREETGGAIDGISVVSDVKMSALSSFKTGGPCAVLMTPNSPDMLSASFRAVKRCGIRFCVLGNGTNVLCSDKGFDGAVILLTALKNFGFVENVMTAECGMPITSAALAASRRALSGLEFAYGIPGTVGGAVYMNAGAYGGETSAVCEKSDYLDLSDFSVKTLSGPEQHFGYRHSAYQCGDKIIIRAYFRLVPGDGELITAQMNEFMRRRIEKQPLEYPSAGSVFKRSSAGYTGEMIEKCGLKGRRIGGAQISEKHAGFIINRGGASSADILALISLVRESVREKFGVELECEIRKIGDFD
ncbi:MAG: UDP-N-acetylmuramate dehydrogenase [Oscillospiraceae bacterium]|nr:UDP-N-acetylmuramate dehydrogenase [Oscillospiraceae bacterium]